MNNDICLPKTVIPDICPTNPNLNSITLFLTLTLSPGLQISEMNFRGGAYVRRAVVREREQMSGTVSPIALDTAPKRDAMVEVCRRHSAMS